MNGLEKYQLTTTAIGFFVSVTILWLVRRDHLHGRFAIWWLSTAAVFALLGLFPTTIDWVAVRLGIGYPPILAVVLGFGFLVLKIIIMDIERSRNEIKIHRLAQRLAILEGEMMENKNRGTSKTD